MQFLDNYVICGNYLRNEYLGICSYDNLTPDIQNYLRANYPIFITKIWDM